MTRTEKQWLEERIRELEDKLAYEMGLNEAIKNATETIVGTTMLLIRKSAPALKM